MKLSYVLSHLITELFSVDLINNSPWGSFFLFLPSATPSEIGEPEKISTSIIGLASESLPHIPYFFVSCMHPKSLQLSLTLCDPMDCSSPGSSVHGILQARIVEWVVMPSSRDLPDPKIDSASRVAPALAGRIFTTSTTWEVLFVS